MRFSSDLAVFMPGYFYWLKPRGKSLNGEPIAPPANKKINPSLLIGAGLFGLGWGLVGICPGPAIVQMIISGWPAVLFVIAMLVGMVSATQIMQKLSPG